MFSAICMIAHDGYRKMTENIKGLLWMRVILWLLFQDASRRPLQVPPTLA